MRRTKSSKHYKIYQFDRIIISNTNGKLFKLDLHEKFHGPHGLVAGMTGSGKSEFIITYILSLAVNFHPEEVAFILIDYKGGGMAKSFEKLPHTAGIITNLDGSSIKRSLVSIQSELKRRQAIFAAVSKETGVSNIDIYKYQKLRREGKVKEPLQHLFIIVGLVAFLIDSIIMLLNSINAPERLPGVLGVIPCLIILSILPFIRKHKIKKVLKVIKDSDFKAPTYYNESNISELREELSKKEKTVICGDCGQAFKEEFGICPKCGKSI